MRVTQEWHSAIYPPIVQEEGSRLCAESCLSNPPGHPMDTAPSCLASVPQDICEPPG